MRIPMPRVLPAAIAALGLLLACKVVILTHDVLDTQQARASSDRKTASVLTTEAHASPADDQVAMHPPQLAAVALPSNGPDHDDPDTAAAEKDLADKMRKKLALLADREKQLDQRSSALDAADLGLRSRLDQLHALSVKLEGLEAERQQRMQADWSGIVKIYEQMKPKDAAAIFDVLDVHVLLQVLDRMNERKAAPVLASMQPERARLATQMLAQMRLHRDAAPTSAEAGPSIITPIHP